MKKTLIFGLLAVVLGFTSCCNSDDNLGGSNHVHQLTKVDAVPANFDHAGTKEYYQCTATEEPCGLYFEDAQGKKAIGDQAALQAWLKSEGAVPMTEPLTFKAVGGANKVKIKKTGEPDVLDLLYSIDGGEWAKFEADKEYDLADGQSMKLKAGADGNKGLYINSDNNYRFAFDDEATGNIEASGSIMSLLSANNDAELIYGSFANLFHGCAKLTKAPELPAKNLATSCYKGMFRGCSLESAPELPATELVDSCYYFMFADCTKLTNASELPAMTMKPNCYMAMYQGCASLTEAPALPATTLALQCYTQMFYKCPSLTKAPSSLPATELDEFCYSFMFEGCTSLIEAPELPATTIKDGSYFCMFTGCSSLTKVPAVLPATTVLDRGYSQMFNECTSLTEAPEISATTVGLRSCYFMFSGCTSLKKAPSVLPATTLGEDCYYSMFYDCPALITAPELPATTLTKECYAYMFYKCPSLTKAPSSLPATTLAESCYYQMFRDCSSLTTAPVLGAKTLAENSCFGMFYNCPNLNSIEVNLTEWTKDTEYWMGYVAATGTFKCPTALPETRGQHNIPDGWTIVRK